MRAHTSSEHTHPRQAGPVCATVCQCVILYPRCALVVSTHPPRSPCSELLEQYQQCSSREDILLAQKKWLEDDIYKGPKRDFPPTSSDSDSGGEGRGQDSDSMLHV